MGKNIYGATDPGRLRTNNEDTFLTEEVMDGRYLAAGVIDGVGGYEGGELAAAIARESISASLRQPFEDVWQALGAALTLANRRILEAKEQDPRLGSMACVLTLALADLEENQFYYAHIGDTRLYLLRDHSLVKVTKDHSFVGFLEDSGRLSEEEAMNHPKRNEVNKALGFAPDLQLQPDYIETGSSPFLPGDLLLLCSDGLTDMVRSGEIASLLSGQGALDRKAAALVDAANHAGGKDNITVVLVENDNKRRQQRATRPKPEKKNEVRRQPPTEQELPDPKRWLERNSLPLLVILALACAVLSAALVFQWLHKPGPGKTTVVPAVPVRSNRNVKELRLRDSIQTGSGRLVLDSGAYGHVILLSDSIQINRDTFRLIGNGTVLRADSSNRNGGFFLSPATRYIYLENLVMEHFPVAVFAAGHTLHLNRVRFIDCNTPVQRSYGAPDSRAVSGLIRDTLVFRTDSLPFNEQVWP